MKKIDAYILTSDIAAKWLYERKCDSCMLDNHQLKESVSELTSKINSQQIPEIMIWNEKKFGAADLHLNEKNFDICYGDNKRYIPPKPFKKPRKKKPGDDWPSVGW